MATCVPPGLAFGTTDGTAAREAIRRWFHTSVSPVGRQVEAELRTKLEMPGLTLRFPALEAFASDTVGKARTASLLVAAGEPVRQRWPRLGSMLRCPKCKDGRGVQSARRDPLPQLRMAATNSDTSV